jgi:phosphatidylinositol-3-phosphatase
MKLKLAATAAFGLAAFAAAPTVFAAEGPIPTGVPRLDHVIVIMMENHGAAQILNNPNAKFINSYAKSVGQATNYFAVAHPSLTNYLEITGGSNFAVLTDGNADWHDTKCQPNIVAKTIDNEAIAANVCPITGTGTDAETPLLDKTNEVQGGHGLIEIDGKMKIPAATNIVGKTIAEQLSAARYTWKSYQESLPITGADGVSSSDGEYTDLTDFSKIKQPAALKPQISATYKTNLYASKHNPFVYFAAGQTAAALKNSVGFEQLYADLASGDVPNYSLVVPNQCNDQHGRGANGSVRGFGLSAYCNFDAEDNGKQAGLNPALIQAGDIAVEKLVDAIHASPVWKDGRTAIVLVWDENDYFNGNETNQVVLTVDKNYGKKAVKSDTFYTHFSLLKTIEGGFGLKCLNHACDASTKTMADLFN